MYGATLLFPNDNMLYEVAATTWTNLLGCPAYKGAATLDAIRAFGKQPGANSAASPSKRSRSPGRPPPNRPNSAPLGGAVGGEEAAGFAAGVSRS